MNITLLNQRLSTLKFPANAEEAFIYIREMVLNRIIRKRNWLIKSYIYFENLETSESKLQRADEAKLLKVLAHHLSLPEAVPRNCTKVLLALFEPFQWTDLRLRLVNGLAKAAVNDAVPTLLNALAMLMQNQYETSNVSISIANTLLNEFILCHSEVCQEMLRLPTISSDFCITIISIITNIYLRRIVEFVNPPEEVFNLIETWLNTQPSLCTRLPFSQNPFEDNRYLTPFRSLLCWTVLGPLAPASSYERYRDLHEILIKSLRECKAKNLTCAFYTGQFFQAITFLKERTDFIKARAQDKNTKLTMEDYCKYQDCCDFIRQTAMEVQNLELSFAGDQRDMIDRLIALEEHYTNLLEFRRLYL